jgi:two-component system, chemotaxis family, sensor kinase CheA
VDDLEEFRQIFFQECNELLQALEEALSSIDDGNHDKDIINAAFRAIHSIKGGAGAFGFDGMVNFCHNFENVLDLIRNDKLSLDALLIRLCLRSKDIVADLVDAAQQGESNLEKYGPDVLAELLYTIENGKAPEPDSIKAKTASDAPVTAKPEATASQPQSQAQSQNQAEEILDDEPPMRDIWITFKPEADLIRAAIEPLNLIAELDSFGPVKADIINEAIPEPTNFKADKCYCHWKITVFTAASLEAIEDVFIFAKEYAEISFEEEKIELPEPVVQKPTVNEPVAEKLPEKQPEEIKITPKPINIADNEDKPVAKTEKENPVKASLTLRVDLQRIDRLVNMVGETVITQSVLAQQASALSPEQHGGLLHAIEALSRQTRELQESVMSIRAQPVKNVFQRMNRLVRELAMSLNKEAKIVLVGENTEVDTTVIEELSDPLVHMIRNAMDHGMETPAERIALGKPAEGTIKLSAEHRSSRIVITVTDDGRGINREKVLQRAIERGLISADAKPTIEEIENMIFLPGFSTADVVSNVSGRGVGMDVVRRNIQALGGRVFISSTPGRGSVFTMALPLTLAVLDGMVIRVGNENFIVPITSIIEASRIDNHDFSILPNGSRVIKMRGEYIRVINLGNALNVPLSSERPQVLVIETETYGQVGMLVDDLIGQQQIVIKTLETHYRRVEGISGATILGDGKVALILDTDAIASTNLGATSFDDLTQLNTVKINGVG